MERVGIGAQQLDPALDTVGGDTGPAQQFLGESVPLSVDPGAIAVPERLRLTATGGRLLTRNTDTDLIPPGGTGQTPDIDRPGDDMQPQSAGRRNPVIGRSR